MKKLTIAALMLLGSFSVASAGPGINVGVSGQIGVFEVKATESLDGARRDSGEAVGAFGYTSLFIEKTIGSRIRIGYDYVPEDLDSETVTEEPADHGLSGSDGSVTNTAKVTFSDISTYYVAVHITENLYAKYGTMTVDVTTGENLETGSTYGNASLDGQVMGMGYHKQADNGFFFRVEGTVMEIDGHTFTSGVTDAGNSNPNQIKVDDFNGVSGKLSVGKAF